DVLRLEPPLLCFPSKSRALPGDLALQVILLIAEGAKLTRPGLFLAGRGCVKSQSGNPRAGLGQLLKEVLQLGLIAYPVLQGPRQRCPFPAQDMVVDERSIRLASSRQILVQISPHQSERPKPLRLALHGA